ncbi:hypothetical protein [Candidatus Hodgkinia cicadicola]|uniref:hypothetical protein n=1 Tax=Candidatus Hodgkinia cicadicola TaxID=573658 RepID=UPI001788D553
MSTVYMNSKHIDWWTISYKPGWMLLSAFIANMIYFYPNTNTLIGIINTNENKIQHRNLRPSEQMDGYFQATTTRY